MSKYFTSGKNGVYKKNLQHSGRGVAMGQAFILEGFLNFCTCFFFTEFLFVI